MWCYSEAIKYAILEIHKKKELSVILNFDIQNRFAKHMWRMWTHKVKQRKKIW